MNGPLSDWSSPVQVVILSEDKRPRLEEMKIPEDVSSPIVLDGDTFTDSGNGEWLGFYDWLRDHDGFVIGVRQKIDEEIQSFPFGADFQGTDMDKSRRLVTIYFYESTNYDEGLSCDQEFGNNRLYFGARSILITFLPPGPVV